MPETNYLSPEEVGKKLRASKWTVRRWVEDSKLPAVRVGRRWLIPADAVDRLVEQQLGAGNGQANTEIPLVITRKLPPRYDYFEAAFDEAELNRRAKIIIAMLRIGGWPDLFGLKTEGVKKILRGEEKAPPAFWRFLCDGLENTLERCEGKSGSELHLPAKKNKIGKILNRSNSNVDPFTGPR